MKVLNLIGEIDEITVQNVSDFILTLEDEDDEILVNITSRGGEIEPLFACLDMLSSLHIEIHTHINGYCYSSALPLFLIGDKRTCGDNTLFMYHKCSYGIEAKMTTHEQQLYLSYKMQNIFDTAITSKTEITQEQLDEFKYNEWYFDRNTAEKLGVINY